jgi:hypothetical protein
MRKKFQCLLSFWHQHRKKLASGVAANQVFVVVTKYTGTASIIFASAKLAARVVAYIMPPSLAELAAVLAANSSDAVTIYAVVATWIRNQRLLILPG